MSVIFQLFSAADLTGLTTGDLEELRNEVTNALYAAATLAHAKKRADQVYEQLTGSVPAQKPIDEPAQIPASIPKQQRQRCPQIFTPENLNQLTDQQKTILEWAIECELQHSYRVLQDIQTKMQYFLSKKKGGMLPQGHDTSYSHIDDPVLRPQALSREYPG
jgi:hypothetical protein